MDEHETVAQDPGSSTDTSTDTNVAKSESRQSVPERIGAVEKCPVCGSRVDLEAYHCPTCRNTFCFHCRARILPSDIQFQCVSQQCEYYGKLLCDVCEEMVEEDSPPAVYLEPQEGYWPLLLIAVLVTAWFIWSWSFCLGRALGSDRISANRLFVARRGTQYLWKESSRGTPTEVTISPLPLLPTAGQGNLSKRGSTEQLVRRGNGPRPDDRLIAIEFARRWPVITELIYQLPLPTLAAMVAIVFVGVYWLGTVALRPVFRLLVRSHGGDNEIVGSVLSSFGVLYGLLMSLITVAAYQSMNDVESKVEAEAASLLALHRDVSDYPRPLREQLQSQVTQYCRRIIDDEWPKLRQGEHPRGAQIPLEEIIQGLTAMTEHSDRSKVIQSLAIQHFEEVAKLGRQRRTAAESSIPAVMWYVVIVGTIINFCLMWSFDMRFTSQLFLGGLVAFFMGSLILLIAVLERPYRSQEFGISPAAFELAHELMLLEETALPVAPTVRE